MSGNWVTDIHGVNVLRKREIASSPPPLTQMGLFSAAASFAKALAPALCSSRLSSGLQGLQVYHCTASSRNRILLSNKSRTLRDLWEKTPISWPLFWDNYVDTRKFKRSKARSAFLGVAKPIIHPWSKYHFHKNNDEKQSQDRLHHSVS